MQKRYDIDDISWGINSFTDALEYGLEVFTFIYTAQFDAHDLKTIIRATMSEPNYDSLDVEDFDFDAYAYDDVSVRLEVADSATGGSIFECECQEEFDDVTIEDAFAWATNVFHEEFL